MNDISEDPIYHLDVNTCKEKCVKDRKCEVFTWRDRKPSLCRLKSSKRKAYEEKRKNRIGDNIPDTDSVSGEKGPCKGCKIIILNHIFQSLCFSA